MANSRKILLRDQVKQLIETEAKSWKPPVKLQKNPIKTELVKNDVSPDITLLFDTDDTFVNNLYLALRKNIKKGMNVKDILIQIAEFTHHCFLKDDLSFIGTQNEIYFEQFLIAQSGTDFNHVILNNYFIELLIEDKLLLGDPFPFSFPANENKLVWNLFHDARSDTLYSVDSARNLVANVDKDTVELRKKYGIRFGQRFNSAYKVIKQGSIEPHLLNIQHYIEHMPFLVGGFGLFKGGVEVKMPDNSYKRLPHRVAEIYKLTFNLKTCSNNTEKEKLWQEIRKTAFEALDKPLYYRKESTTDFYRNVLMLGKIPSSEPVNLVIEPNP